MMPIYKVSADSAESTVKMRKILEQSRLKYKFQIQDITRHIKKCYIFYGWAGGRSGA